MKRPLYILLLLLAIAMVGRAQSSLEDIEQRLLDSPVQEKVFLHMDNTCYYKGDTIWYKAYVVRADDLTFTDMSRILYVELVSPDGMLVERQQVIVSDEGGYSNGNFQLRDSIYSGYYELRAYTRWMLNFRVSEHNYGRRDREMFYNAQMAKDFFRQFGTVYSRVFPVYERPEEPGDYALKYIVSRPKSRLEKELKEKLIVNFYPEGGHLVAGKRCNVAFEAQDEEGEQVDIEGTVGGQAIKTEHQGRGSFSIDVPESGRLTANFNYKGKDYHIDLPKSERSGCALSLSATGDDIKASISIGGYMPGLRYGAAVLCRGELKAFKEMKPDDQGQASVAFSKAELSTGVCDLLIVDEMGRPLADRLFFVNNHDYDQDFITVEGGNSYEPFEQIKLTFQAPADADHISIAVRDGATDDPSYDTGNMLTDLLLSSELKGFVAYPHYYFESDDAEHQRHLDLLMMVQGWRRYDYQEMTSQEPLRYKPETAITVEGAVYPTADSDEFESDEVRYWSMGILGYSPSKIEMYGGGTAASTSTDDTDTASAAEGTDNAVARVNQMLREKIEKGDWKLSDNVSLEKMSEAIYVEIGPNDSEMTGPGFSVSYGGLKHEVTVKGELVFEDDIATIEQETINGGHFAFAVPPYYGQAILFLKAHDTDISEKKAKRLETKGFLDEGAWPEYYVKRDLFFPVFAKKYSFYQCHQPEDDLDDALLQQSEGNGEGVGERLSSFDRELQGVTVKKKRRRGRRAIDYSKPACVYDAQELYNLATDRGLSYGRYDARQFPVQMSMALLGNYNSERQMNVMGRMNDRELTPYIYFRNYNPGPSAMEQNRTDQWVNNNLKLARQDEVRLYTDFELRNEDKHVEQSTMVADVTLDFMLMANEGKRYTYRDRRIILDGMTEPADFYHPNYGARPLPKDMKDYRRTLYWNPNAPLDSEGRFTATFYNNGKQTRIKVDAAGLTNEGHPITTK